MSLEIYMRTRVVERMKLQVLVLLSVAGLALGCVPGTKTLRRSSTKLGLEVDPVLASALATCVVRAPSMSTLIRTYVAHKRLCSFGPWSAVRRVLSRWACVDELSFPKLVWDSVCSQSVEYILDMLPRWH